MLKTSWFADRDSTAPDLSVLLHVIVQLRTERQPTHLKRDHVPHPLFHSIFVVFSATKAAPRSGYCIHTSSILRVSFTEDWAIDSGLSACRRVALKRCTRSCAHVSSCNHESVETKLYWEVCLAETTDGTENSWRDERHMMLAIVQSAVRVRQRLFRSPYLQGYLAIFMLRFAKQELLWK